MDSKCKFAAAAALVGLVVGTASMANASVLTFDGNICNGNAACASGGQINQAYGDTASVDVQYNRDITNGSYVTGAAGSNLLWWDNYADLTGVAWGGVNDVFGTPMIFLAPTTALSVTLLGFDLGAYANLVLGTQITLVDGTGNTLFSSGPLVIGAGNTHTHFAFNISSNNGIGIQWGPSGYDVGIDNIEFTSEGGDAVPEPTTWMLLLSGLGLAGASLRRARRTDGRSAHASTNDQS